MSKEKIVRLTDQQMMELRQGNILNFMENFIKLGASLQAEHKTVTVKGPYQHKDEDEAIFFVSYQEKKL